MDVLSMLEAYISIYVHLTLSTPKPNDKSFIILMLWWESNYTFLASKKSQSQKAFFTHIVSFIFYIFPHLKKKVFSLYSIRGGGILI